jgi:phosphoribosyl-ATP pyrophosphohydrolase/phosphoribosyl-AMP cyclohydrolase
MTKNFDEIKFDARGLVPAVVQDYQTKEVLMVAYMNRTSLEKTICGGKACYFSRSRQKLWLKGETSGHFQFVKSIKYDCDGDTLLLEVEQIGEACHTGNRSCFFRTLA